MLPLVAESDPGGEIVALIGHYSARTPGASVLAPRARPLCERASFGKRGASPAAAPSPPAPPSQAARLQTETATGNDVRLNGLDATTPHLHD